VAPVTLAAERSALGATGPRPVDLDERLEPGGDGHAVGGDTPNGKDRGDEMFMTLFVVLFVAWLLGWAAFHVAGGLIHLLLIVAVISLIVHFVRGRRATA